MDAPDWILLVLSESYPQRATCLAREPGPQGSALIPAHSAPVAVRQLLVGWVKVLDKREMRLVSEPGRISPGPSLAEQSTRGAAQVRCCCTWAGSL